MALHETLSLVPGLKNIKEEHVNGDTISWKVRQVSFVALFDELARQGVAGLESNCAKLRELCGARASALRVQKSKRADVRASPPAPKLSIGGPALTTEAFRASFTKVVVDIHIEI